MGGIRILSAVDPDLIVFEEIPSNAVEDQLASWLNVNLYVQWIYDKFDAATDVKVEGVTADSPDREPSPPARVRPDSIVRRLSSM